MTNLLKKEEVNTVRQKELDLVKGFLLIMIIAIHSFQTIANAEAVESNTYKIIFGFFMLSGACLYLFVMGFGSVYSRHSSPKELAINGVKLLFFQLLSNLIYCVCIIVFFWLRNALFGTVEGSVETYHTLLYAMLTFVNIFFIAGIGYLVLAVFKLIKMPKIGYGISAVVVGITSPFLATIQVENSILNFALDTIFGGKGDTSFCAYPYLSFVFLGYIFAKVLRRVEEGDKTKFYKLVGIVSGVGVIIWVTILWIKFQSIGSLFDYLYVEYRIASLAKVVGSTLMILLEFAIFYATRGIENKAKFIYNRLINYSKNISKMYAVHIGVYWVIASLFAFCGFGVVQCLGISVIVLVITDALVTLYVKCEKIIRKK